MLRLLKKCERPLLRVFDGSSRRWTTTSSGPKKTAVMSFGDGSHGALGLPTSLLGMGSDAYEPTPVPGLPPDVSSIAAGHYHSLAVTSQGEVWAWGRNQEIQLGRDPLSPRETWNEPKKVQGLSQVRVKAAFASGVISSAIGDDGSLWVWGKSKRGQLGLGEGITEALSPSRVKALAGENIIKVALGWGHALALTRDGKLFGWGYYADGRLGKIRKDVVASPLDSTSGSTFEVAEKLVLEGIEKEKNMPIVWDPCVIEELCGVEVIDMACGLDHSLVLCCDGTLLSGGSNVYGQLGRSKQDLGMFPVDISFKPISVSSGLGHSFAIRHVPSSEVFSWGWNRNSQLGREGSENFPAAIDGLSGEKPISVAGGRAHSIALTENGEVWTWGCGRNGRLGLGSSTDEVEPMLVECLEGVKVLQAVCGFDHSLVLVVAE